jgi:ABC-type transport system involved in multi-copper enzyme maturation permease subunit
MRGITRDCVVEMFDRKTVYLFIAVTFIAVVLAFLSPKMEVEFYSTGNVDMGSMGDFLTNPVTKALSTYLMFMVFLAVMASAGLVPSMLARGRADFYLSKPISRTSLLLNKLFSIWLVYGGTVVLCGLLIYAALALTHGFFDWKIFYIFILVLVNLFIWLSITTTAGIVTGSTAMSVMSAFLVWVAQVILHWHEQIKGFLESKPVGYIVDGLYYILPKTSEVSAIADACAFGKPIESWMPLYSSLIFSTTLVALGVVIFKRKNY